MNVIATEKGDLMERDLLRYEAKHYNYSSKAILCTSDIEKCSLSAVDTGWDAGMHIFSILSKMHSPLESDSWNII